MSIQNVYTVFNQYPYYVLTRKEEKKEIMGKFAHALAPAPPNLC